MKNQKVLRILALVFAVAMMLTIASCEMLDQLLGKAPEHVHTEESIPAVAPTCTSIGLTEGKKCSDCGEILVAQETVAALGHKEVAVPAKEATCTTIGLTEGKKCSACDTWIVAQEVVNAKGHTEETLAAVEPTCTEKGLTEGKKCTTCGVTTVAQKEVDALGHTWGEEVTVTVEPTCGEDGKGTVGCTACDATNEVVVDATGEHTWDEGVETVAPSCADGVMLHTCSVCNDTKEEAIPAIGEHAYDEGTVVAPATCITTGIKLRVCDVCGGTKKIVLAATKDILDQAKFKHVFQNGKCKDCGACEKHSYQTYDLSDEGYANDARFDHMWGKCSVCGFVDENHEHILKGNACMYCDYVFETTRVASSIGANKYHYFAQALPERFRDGADDYVIDAFNENLSTKSHSEWDQVRANQAPYCPYPHIYLANNTGDLALQYKLTVEKEGVYEVAIYLRVKDTQDRGAKFVINAGTAYEYSIEHSYAWKTTDDVNEARNNQFLIGGYMFIELELKAGENVIDVYASKNAPKTQHYRGFYFNLKEEKHVHAYTGTDVVTTEATCGADGLRTYTCASCQGTKTEVIPATGLHVDDNNDFACDVCTKDLRISLEEAYAIGKACSAINIAGANLGVYYITIKLDQQVNPNGFARGTIAENKYISINGGYLTGEAEGSIVLGDTVVLRGNMGKVNSTLDASGQEARMFNVTLVEIVTPAQ